MMIRRILFGRDKQKDLPTSPEVKFESIEEIQQALRTAGLETSSLIIGIDFTKSNLFSGVRTFEGRSLHLVGGITENGISIPLNPYQRVISILGRTLEVFDDDDLIPTYGFGDVLTKNHSVFPFFEPDRPCNSFREVLARYSQIAPHVKLSGPTNFAPLIKKSIAIIKSTEKVARYLIDFVTRFSYHILIIIADGLVTDIEETRSAIADASHYPLSIVVIGVGDGPWDMIEDFERNLPKRAFNNFQFVSFEKSVEESKKSGLNLDSCLAKNALMTIPSQYNAIKRLGYLQPINSSK